MSQSNRDATRDCCGRLFFAHRVEGRAPLIVLECCSCGRLWHRREDGRLVPYDHELFPVIGNTGPDP